MTVTATSGVVGLERAAKLELRVVLPPIRRSRLGWVSYPDHWEADVVLADGGTAHLRPIRPGDAEPLRAFHSRLSPESIYYRFFSPRPRLTDREIEHFTTVDYRDRVALICTVGDDMIAVVRYDKYDKTDASQAEVAFLVEDAHQGRGLGTVLL